MIYQRKIMGLDVGDKRIGIALSDPLRITAQGLTTYERKDQQSDVAYIKKLFEEHNVEKIVCGFPKNMNGTIGPQAEKVKAFAALIEHATGSEIVYFDERLSTVFAERTLIEADVSRMKRKKVIDKLAAVTILQGYLDSLSK